MQQSCVRSSNGHTLATLIPTGVATELTASVERPTLSAATCYVLSRFAYIRREGQECLLESPLSSAKIVLHNWRLAALVQRLTAPCSQKELEELAQQLPGLSPESLCQFLRLLLAKQMICRVDEAGQPDEEQPSLVQWEFHDLLFHTRSRLGRHEQPCGASFRFLGSIEPLPAVKPALSAPGIPLYAPDMAALKETDVPFTRVLEERRSCTSYGASPLSVQQLGEFLYRTARVRAVSEPTADHYERSNRPYPSGGACYELELYVVVNRCAGLSAGLYHYCPGSHQLYQVSGKTHEVETLIAGAVSATGVTQPLQVMLVYAARFQRVSWKYSGISYALILKHVGVLFQTMYLVATAMQLAARAVGGGDADVFTAAAGTDYYAESSVGEFLLGIGEKTHE